MPKRRRTRANEVWSVIEALQRGETIREVAAKTGRTLSTVRDWKKKYGKFTSLVELEVAISPEDNRYVAVMKKLFAEKFKEGSDGFDWERADLDRLANEIGIKVVKNLGDNVYSIRHGREDLPEEIRALAPKGRFWLLLPNGKSAYRFVLTDRAFLDPDDARRPIKIPDSTPQIVARYAKQDEQAVLARIRYCRLVDIFMGLASYQLQSHMRTTIAHFGGAQTELDEIYVGVDSNGTQFVIPIQAKSEGERIGAIQIITDHFTCLEKFPKMVARTLAAKTMRVRVIQGFGEVFTIALVECAVDENYNVTKVKEEHFELLPAAMINDDELAEYRSRFSR
jgi:transposase